MSVKPFYVGQKVSSSFDIRLFGIKKGDVFTVNKIYNTCCSWVIEIGLPVRRSFFTCIYCGNAFTFNSSTPFDARLFHAIMKDFQPMPFTKFSKKLNFSKS